MAKASNKEANIRTYFGEVNKFGQNGEYDKAIKSLNKSELLINHKYINKCKKINIFLFHSSC